MSKDCSPRVMRGDVAPLALDLAEIKARLEHVPTRFGLLLASVTPTVASLWWMAQQILAHCFVDQ